MALSLTIRVPRALLAVWLCSAVASMIGISFTGTAFAQTAREVPIGQAAEAEEIAGEPTAIEPFELRLSGKRVHFLRAGPVDGFPVLLLHGARFSAETWRDLGTIELLARQGFQVWAMDLPGYGQSEASDAPAENFLASVLPLLSERPMVVVSPSMSGRFSLPLVIDRPGWVAGFVPVAPGGVQTYLPKLQGSKVPTLIFWGENDAIVSPKDAEKMARAMPASRKVVIPGASHPCYLDSPFEFHRELLHFLNGL